MYDIDVNLKEKLIEITNPDRVTPTIQATIVGLIVLIILVIRIISITRPQLQWTAWKEIDYLYLSQNFWQNGFNFFRPEISWPAEPPRVTEMELPIVPFTAAILYKLTGYNVYSARAITLFSFLLLVIYVYRLTKRELNTTIGFVAAFTAGILPLYHPFGKFLFTEPTMIAFSVVAIYYIAEWVEFERRRNWWQALISISLTFALKLESLYLLLPITWIAFRQYHFSLRKYNRLIVLILLALILPIIWYSYAFYLELNGAHLFGIFTGHNKSQTLTMLTQLGWYRTMAGRIINGIFGGFYGTFLFFIGLVIALVIRRGGLFYAYLIAVGIYFGLVAEGNIDAPYRQLTIVPPASIFIALGTTTIINAIIVFYQKIKDKTILWFQFRAIQLLVALLLVSIIPLSEYRSILGYESPAHWDRWVVAQELAEYTNSESKLVALGEYSKHVGGYDLSPVLYYYTGLQGWTLTPENWNLDHVEGLKQKGATLIVILEPYNDPTAVNYQPEESVDSFVKSLKLRYHTLSEEPGWIMLDLRNPVQ